MKNNYHRRNWGTCYDFVITRNGDIVDMRETIYQNNYFDSIVKDIILSVKPNPSVLTKLTITKSYSLP